VSQTLPPGDRERLVSLFDSASALPSAARAAFVERECGSNRALRTELERLLAGLSGEDVFERLADTPLPPGMRIGPYRILEQVGHGGMGEVYAAEQVEPVVRRVALKVIRRGMDSAQVVVRFEAERQALARMSHPNVAQVFDGGTMADGRPYFVMEYVAGESITDYCDRHRLSTRERVALFIAVCEGVQHAHQKGLIHRDLKPSNLLVMQRDGEPVAKVIDFGVARATTGRLVDRTLQTMVGQIVGTLDYMSPEQADPNGMDVDTRSDIYSLGVVLYQLLSGLLPFDLSSTDGLRFSEVQRAICSQEAVKPSTRLRRESGSATAIALAHGTDERVLVRQLAGDLDWICMKALEKDPARRYASVSELAQDLRRHLAHEPVLAGRPGVLYRARKFVRRHRVGVTAGAALIVVALAGLGGIAAARLETAARADEVFRLSAAQRLENLIAEAKELWPADEDHLGRYEDWLARAERLVAELPDHETKLRELRQRARPREQEQAAWIFDDEGEQWWHNQLATLIDRLRAFAHPEVGLLSAGVAPEHGWGVRRRADFARSIRARTVAGAEAAAAWQAAAARVAASARYGGLVLQPQIGLLPLGPDPVSGLEEFAHPQTGSVPTRDDAGKLVLSEAMGLVFVLLPGGDFAMGAQGSDPTGPNYDPEVGPDQGPVHHVTLSPFFLSKFEMTQGQWQRFAGRNPSRNQPATLGGLHPVEAVDASDCGELCVRLGLVLPSEAEWEYAARAGTSSPWWTGDSFENLNRRVNAAGVPGVFRGHAPVGSYPANAFGLCEVAGNVFEWCRDGFDAEFYANSPRVDPVGELREGVNRVMRGGGYGVPAWGARSAARRITAPNYNGGGVGLRPARAMPR
jgi:serine/threonine protein kinase/formylglycine-generating enzyme required for sulfatase activity